MSKFQNGDVAWFKKTNQQGLYVRYTVDFVEDGIVYMTDDTDIPETQLLTQNEYDAVATASVNRHSKSTVSADASQSAMEQYLNSRIIKDDAFNTKVIQMFDSVNTEFFDFVAFSVFEAALIQAKRESEITNIDFNKIRLVLKSCTQFEIVEFASKVYGCPVGLMQEAVRGMDRNDTGLVEMTISRCVMAVLHDMAKYRLLKKCGNTIANHNLADILAGSFAMMNSTETNG